MPKLTVQTSIAQLNLFHFKKLVNTECTNHKNDQPYLAAYPHLRHFISECAFETDADFILAAHLVYAWMPRVLKLTITGADGINLLQPASEALRKAKGADSLSASELQSIAAPFNGSYVAPSKLLHFRNPTRYAIWDSRVLRGIVRITGNPDFNIYHYHMCRLELFEAYQNKLFELASELPTGYIYIPGQEKATPLRRLEYLLFVAGRA